jgi:hypothetical protein
MKTPARIEPKEGIRMYLVVCGRNEITHTDNPHAAVCFDHDVAMAESKQMKKSGYSVKGIFEITTLNIFNKVPYYLEKELNL